MYQPTRWCLVETWVYELAKKYQDYDIAVVCKSIAQNQWDRLTKLCPVYIHKGQRIKCKTIITNYDSSILDYTDAENEAIVTQYRSEGKKVEPENICETIHADYTDPHYEIFPKIDKRVNHWLGITKHVCKTFKEKFGVETELCYNPLSIEENQAKQLILLSATRLSPIKGVNRMIALKEALDKKGINYIWFIFSNENKIKGENIIYMKPTMDIRRWIKTADYLVQLSDSEACSYSINEALVMGTPVIVTPLPYLEELGIKDGENAYILNFNLSNLGSVVDRIQNVPKFEFELPKDNYDKYVIKEHKSKYKEMLKMKFLIEATNKYEEQGISDNELSAKKGKNYIPKKGEQWAVGFERKELLIAKGFAKLVEEIKEEKVVQEPKKATKKAKKGE